MQRKVSHIITWCALFFAAASGPTSHPATRPALNVAIVHPDGTPAGDAVAALVPPGHYARVTDGRTFDDDPIYVRASVGSDGRVTLPTGVADGTLLAVVAPAGHAEVDASIRGTVQLTPWARVEGRRIVRGKPAANRRVTAWSDTGTAADAESPHGKVYFSNSTRTDADGRYVLDRLPAGQANIAADDPVAWDQDAERPLFVAQLAGDRPTQFDVAGHGRPLVGRVTLPPELARRNDWEYWYCIVGPAAPTDASPTPAALSAGPLSKQAAWWSAFNKTPAGTAREAAETTRYPFIWSHTYLFDVRPDGTFSLEDVEPGTYDLGLIVLTRKGAGPRLKLAEASARITVPPGGGDEPITLPPVEVKMKVGLQVGDAAPDFTEPGLDDRPVRLSDLRGQLVLLDFWATWCGPCVGETPSLLAAYREFGRDGRVTMIGLSEDRTPDRPLVYTATHGMAWRQAFVGFDRKPGGACDRFDVDGIPSIWLIGRDGRVLAKNLRGDGIAAAIRAALAAPSPK